MNFLGLDPFLLFALAAAFLVALVAAPFGCFLIWRRASYAADALAHASLFGVAVSIAARVPLMAAALATMFLVVGLVFALRRRLGLDALFTVGSHGALAFGVCALYWLRAPVDWEGILFGDILAVGGREIALLAGGGVFLLVGLAVIYRPLLAATLAPEIARVEFRRAALADSMFFVLVALLVALAAPIVGVLLVNSLAILTAAAARPFAATPRAMIALSIAAGFLSAAIGLFAAVRLDLPAGPAMTACASLLFVAAWTAAGIIKRR